MCATCAIVVATAATGARAGLRAYVTPRVLKFATVGLCVVALVGGSVSLGGSSSATAPAARSAAR